MASALEDLDEKEKQVVTFYYLEELTMKEVGAVLGVGESRVSQIHAVALIRLARSAGGDPAGASAECPEGICAEFLAGRGGMEKILNQAEIDLLFRAAEKGALRVRGAAAAKHFVEF